jgi:hypothetical protein
MEHARVNFGVHHRLNVFLSLKDIVRGWDEFVEGAVGVGAVGISEIILEIYEVATNMGHSSSTYNPKLHAALVTVLIADWIKVVRKWGYTLLKCCLVCTLIVA